MGAEKSGSFSPSLFVPLLDDLPLNRHLAQRVVVVGWDIQRDIYENTPKERRIGLNRQSMENSTGGFSGPRATVVTMAYQRTSPPALEPFPRSGRLTHSLWGPQREINTHHFSLSFLSSFPFSRYQPDTETYTPSNNLIQP